MLEAGTRHVAAACPKMADVIRQVGPCALPARRPRYATLIRSIVSQQISTKAAASVFRKLRLAAGGHVTAERIAGLGTDELRAAGLSGQKSGYIEDLTARVLDGRVRLGALDRMDDEAVIEHLTQIRGIGRWSAEMVLIFILNRPDVLPVDDLGIQNGFQKVYGMRSRPKKDRMFEIASAWAPFRTIGSWYLWRCLDSSPG